jgi:membrane-associated phospholipid phosphatase
MIRAPLITRDNQLRALVLGYVLFSVIYLTAGMVHWRPPQLLAGNAVDAAIPLLEHSVWIYASQFLLAPLGIVLARDDADRSRAFYAMLLATLLAAPLLVAWPTQIDRPQLHVGAPTAYVWLLLYRVDVPTNCFPSLHVALACISGTALWRRGWRLWGTVWPALICISTLTTKQHVTWDVAGGMLLAASAWFLTPILVRHERATIQPDLART